MYNDCLPDSIRWHTKTVHDSWRSQFLIVQKQESLRNFPLCGSLDSCLRWASELVSTLLFKLTPFFNSLLWSAQWILKIRLLLAACFYLSWTVDFTASIVFHVYETWTHWPRMLTMFQSMPLALSEHLCDTLLSTVQCPHWSIIKLIKKTQLTSKQNVWAI